jgi:predicted ArsR family transcriptional regulator
MAEQFDLLAYPASPGVKSKGDTSGEAATASQKRAATLRDAVYDVLKRCPCTADEVAGHLRENILSIRPRLSELVAMSRITDTGLRRKNKSGRSAVVWKVTVDA